MHSAQNQTFYTWGIHVVSDKKDRATGHDKEMRRDGDRVKGKSSFGTKTMSSERVQQIRITDPPFHLSFD